MQSFKISTPSMLAPTRMDFTSTANAGDVMVLNVRRWN